MKNLKEGTRIKLDGNFGTVLEKSYHVKWDNGKKQLLDKEKVERMEVLPVFTEQVEALQSAISNHIETLLRTEKGKQSQWSSDLVLVVKDEDNLFALDKDRYLSEVTADELIDHRGYRYAHTRLRLEDLCTVVDNLTK